MKFPSPEKEQTLHSQVCSDDPVAPADVFAALASPLSATVKLDQKCDDDVAYDSAIDAILEYLRDPGIYDPSRGRLGTFLTQIAKRRAIDRIRARSAQVKREKNFADVVELRTSTPNEGIDERLDAEVLRREVAEVVQDPKDRRVLELILEGEKSTAVLARELGLDQLTGSERTRAVKRNRDRLMKVLERLGRRMTDERST